MKKLIKITIFVAGLFLLLVNKASAASYSCFPTCRVDDGRFLSSVGSGMGSFDNVHFYITFSAPSEAETIEIGIFDGDSGGEPDNTHDEWWNGNWDNTTRELRYTLYTDRNGDGIAEIQIGEWLGNASNPTIGSNWYSDSAYMPNNDWWNLTVDTTTDARSSSGNYIYLLEIQRQIPGVDGVSTFKVRSSYSVSIGASVFGIMPPLYTQSDVDILHPDHNEDYSILGPSNYEGIYNLYLDMFTSREGIVFWDGDLDYGADDGSTTDNDDPDTSNTELPPWVGVGEANFEGIHNGAPGDDTWWTEAVRPPSVNYNFITPSEVIYFNGNPSGDSEWEKFSLLPDYSGDYHLTSLLSPGIYILQPVGYDMVNTAFFRIPVRTLGVDESGDPVLPYRPYEIGQIVWFDENKNGILDDGEKGIEGVIVEVYDSNGELIGTAQTNEGGWYYFGVEAVTNDLVTSEEIYDGIYTARAAQSNFEEGGVLEGALLTSTDTEITYQITDESIYEYNFGYYSDILAGTGKGNIILLLSLGFVLISLLIIKKMVSKI